MSANHQNPIYKDAVDVIAGLARLTDDLADLAGQISTTRRMLKLALHQNKLHMINLDVLSRQLHWLAGDVERMQAALPQEETPHVIQ
ncbi:hypothetical protein [Oleidesulfovibrio alaskensis]|jgi:hypothetical protein|uniref:hypothetical protein n=1 Tax=Oleidesulfovibrio alaskensis TaxID=58180 RepID=UPI00041F390F|nr:hypothetical protein [Oleidesulfovibrio alaskensis]